MRLSAIKLAGFKSFVDPTVIPIVGQMVGVVGPNGCGKSNVIDAVRWVLGESQAKQLRGASMEDVIFNGSGTRKPVSRASVELVFDNSLGKAPGQWASYAEISVKRILTRNGESSYHINNQHVRRRDLVDIFLGTGLGTKTSYAIIEQGMISRIIEAKPDELRGFLEEAAGISKYKERRRETETRLRDTRDNLLRLDDIRRELNEQIARLHTQAEVARQYHRLQAELKTAQQLLWLAKKREAQSSRERYTRQIDETTLQIDAQTAQLRASETEIETARAAHEAASAALNAAQGDFYAATAEVSRLEQVLRHQAETRARLAAQIAQLTAQRDSLTQQRSAMEASLAQWQQRLEDSSGALEEAQMAYQEVTEALPEISTLLSATQSRVADAQRALSLCEQSRQIDETHQQHAAKTLQQLQSRLTRLQHEAGGLPQLDHAALAHSETELQRLNAELDSARAALDAAQHALPALELQRQPLRQRLDEVTRRLHQLDGQLAGLQKIQSHVDSNAQLDAWLQRHQLDTLPRLWQHIQVDAGWDTALEAVLREYVNAIGQPEARLDALLADAPPVRVSLFDATVAGQAVEVGGLPRLLDKIQFKSGQGGALHDWLAHTYVADDAAAAEALRHQLGDGACVVCPQGHVFTRHSVRFHAQHSAGQGVLARQREIERLALEVDESGAQRDELTEQVEKLDEAVRAAQQQLSHLRSQLGHVQQQQHQAQIDSVRQQQAAERVHLRSAQITAETAEIEALMQQEGEEQLLAEERLREHRSQSGVLRDQLEDARRARQDAESLLNQKRDQQRLAERTVQETRFGLQTSESKIKDLHDAIKAGNEQFLRLGEQLGNIEQEHASFDESAQHNALQQAIAERQLHEQQLTASRTEVESVQTRLRHAEETRMRAEHALTPLRNRLEELRLKEQETRLGLTQCDEQLLTLQADETALAAALAASGKANHGAEITRLTAAIDALGAVNLAALEELQHASERESYLNEQGNDLHQAIAVLEEAIYKIDGETRALLKTTFDTVNQSMSELFTTLFGGGQAQLILTGDELLDAGVQVFAQPPGKKNSSIHLLSGGEKALTALSLVFALFKLTPAPFCLLDEVDAPLDDTNTERYARLVKQMSDHVQFLFITHNRITMEAAQQLIGVTMQESGVSRTVAVDLEQAASLAGA